VGPTFYLSPLFQPFLHRPPHPPRVPTSPGVPAPSASPLTPASLAAEQGPAAVGGAGGSRPTRTPLSGPTSAAQLHEELRRIRCRRLD
jgi:hypothetical protein